MHGPVSWWLLSTPVAIGLLLQDLEAKPGLDLGDGGGSAFPGMGNVHAPLQPDWLGIHLSA